MSAIKLSIIIVAYGDPSLLAKCLNSIPKIPTWEIIIIDNTKHNIGFAAGCNRGAAKARGEYVLFLNPDCEVDKENIAILITHLDAFPNTGIVAPKIVNAKHQSQLSYSLQPTYTSAFFVYSFLSKYAYFLPVVKNHWFNQRVATKLTRVGAVTGAVFLMRTDLFKKLKGFDEHFFMYWEETDLCRRCLAAGMRIMYEPKAVVVHEGAATTPKNRNLVLGWFKRSRLYFFQKHFGLIRAYVLESFLRLSESWRTVLPVVLFGAIFIGLVRLLP